jgi:hypothetical protein
MPKDKKRFSEFTLFFIEKEFSRFALGPLSTVAYH